MSLREEMWKYEQITGESAEHVPLMKLGAFLDGYEMGIEASEQTDVLDKIREEIIKLPTISFNANDVYKADILQIINKYKAESEAQK